MVATPEMKKELLSLKKEELTATLISKLFGTTKAPKTKEEPFKVIPPKLPTGAKIHLDAGEYINKTAVDTNIGIVLFNKLFIEKNLEEIVPNGFYNEVITAKKMKNLSQMVANGVMDGKIQIIPNVVEYLKAYEFWGLKLSSVFAVSFTPTLLNPPPELRAKMEETKQKSLLAKTPEELIRLEDELVDFAKKVYANDPGMPVFSSGARGSFENDYKNMLLAVGLIDNPITGKSDYMESSFLGGISKKDIPIAGNSIINAEYPKAKGTRKGGKDTKIFYNVFQNLVLDEPGTDCGTKEGLLVTLTSSNLDDYIDQYAFGKNGKYVLITNDNAKELINKKVKVRSPMFCLNDKICNKCAGERFYKLGITNYGLVTANITSRLLNAGMKLRHSLKQKLYKVNPDELLR